MMELLRTQLVPDVRKSKEKPQRTHLVVVPEVKLDSGLRVRQSMHTDNIANLLRALSRLPQDTRTSLEIEGRDLTPEQFEELGKNDLYRFFMAGRLQRVLISGAQEAFAYIYPKDSSFQTQEVGELVVKPFSPSSLAYQLHYQTAYYNAHDLVERWLSSANPNELLPLLGGCNEFTIGSNTLSPEQLTQVSASIRLFMGDLTFFTPPQVVRNNPSLTSLYNVAMLSPASNLTKKTNYFNNNSLFKNNFIIAKK